MAWFASPKSSAALEAFRLCDLLDQRVAELHSFLDAAAGVLCEPEYAVVVAEFDRVMDPVRQLRGRLDTVIDTHPPAKSGTEAGEAAYTAIAGDLDRALRDLDTPAVTLQRYGNAKAETEYAAGRLTADLGQARSLVATLPEPQRPAWLDRIDRAQGQLNAAAGHAQERRWLQALDMVEAAGDDIAALLSGAGTQAAAAAAAIGGLTRLSELLAQVRQAGAAMVAEHERLRDLVPRTVHDDARETLAGVGRTVVAARAVLEAQDPACPDTATVAATIQGLDAALSQLEEVRGYLRTHTPDGGSDQEGAA